MPRHAIMILCHDRPEQVDLLAAQFPAANFDVFIHVDRKSAILPGIRRRENVFFVPEASRVDVRWGCFSQVEATLALLRMIDLPRYDYVHLISGADFPIKSPGDILEACRSGLEFIESKPLPEATGWAWGGLDRVLVPTPDWLIRRPHAVFFRALRIIWREFVMRTGLFKRRRWPAPKFYAGAQWFSITGALAAWMLGYLDSHPDYCRFFAGGACVDEIFFATLVRLSPFADRLGPGPMRMIRWTGGADGGPATLTARDIPAMVAHPGFFARKITDISVCEQIRDRLLKP